LLIKIGNSATKESEIPGESSSNPTAPTVIADKPASTILVDGKEVGPAVVSEFDIIAELLEALSLDESEVFELGHPFYKQRYPSMEDSLQQRSDSDDSGISSANSALLTPLSDSPSGSNEDLGAFSESSLPENAFDFSSPSSENILTTSEDTTDIQIDFLEDFLMTSPTQGTPTSLESSPDRSFQS